MTHVVYFGKRTGDRSAELVTSIDARCLPPPEAARAR